MFRLGVYVGFFGVFIIFGLFAAMAGLRSGIERLQTTTREPKKAAKRQASLENSSIILIRDNSVTVYDSKELAEASMEWADVVRNPSRRAFDAKGGEFVFKRRAANGNFAPVHSLWNGTNPDGVELEAKSVIPRPDELREALIHWLGGKGVQVENGIDLEKAILLATRTRYGRPAGDDKVADQGGTTFRADNAAEVLRVENINATPPDAESNQDEPRGTGAIPENEVHPDCVEDIAIGSVVIIRNNGVAVYDSKAKAEESMEWSDVMRNPSRRAFDLKGIELRFAHQPRSGYYSDEEWLKLPLWKKLLVRTRRRLPDERRNDVKLVPISPIPHLEMLRESLLHWLDANGVTVDSGIDLDRLIVRASETRSRPRFSY
jgi:hypothetical protein